MLQRLHEPKYSYIDPLEQHQAHLVLVLVSITFVVVIAELLILPIASLFIDGISIGLLIGAIVPLVAILLAVRQLVQSGLARYGAALFVAGAVIFNFMLFLSAPTVDNPIIASFAALVLLVGVLLGRQALVMATLGLGGVLILAGFIQYSTNYFPSIDDSRYLALRLMFGYLSAIGAVGVVLFNYLSATTPTIRSSYRALHTVEACNQVSQYLRETSSPTPSLLRSVTDKIQAAFGVYSVRLFVGSVENMRLVGATGLIGERLLVQQLILDTKGASTTALAVQRRTAVVTTLTDPKIQQVDFHLTTKAELAAPLLVSGQVVGVLALQNDREASFTEGQIHLINGLADQLALVVQWIQNNDRITQLEGQIAEARQQSQDRQRELRDLAQATTQQEWLNFLTSAGEQTAFQWTGKNVERWQPANATPPQTTVTLEQSSDGQQKMVVPIVLGNRSLGELVFETSSTVQWTDQTLELVQEVANRLALALDNARLFNQTRMTALREQAVGSVASELQRSRDIETLVKQASALFSQVLGAEQTAIRLVRD